MFSGLLNKMGAIKIFKYDYFAVKMNLMAQSYIELRYRFVYENDVELGNTEEMAPAHVSSASVILLQFVGAHLNFRWH